MNATYNVRPRLFQMALNRGEEKLARDELNNKQLNEFFQSPYVFTPRVLKDGSDSVGVLGALNRVYLNIGLFSEEWLLHFHPFLGATPLRGITPIRIADAERNSEYWKATEAQTPYMVRFLLKAAQPDHLKDAPGGDAYLEKDRLKQDRGKIVFAERCARCHSSKSPKLPADLDFNACNGPGYLECWNKYWEWTKSPKFKEDMTKIVQGDNFLDDNFLSTDMRIPVTLLRTNVCSPLATNAIAGNIWDSFSSQSYKDLPSVGSVELFPPWNGEDGEVFDPVALPNALTDKAHTYEMPAGGRGYTRVPSLISLWSTAPFLLNNTLGDFNSNPSVEARMKSFDSSIRQLLWPEKRKADGIFAHHEVGVGTIDRTTAQSYLEVPAGYLPDWLSPWRTRLHNFAPWIFDEAGDIEIGPIPAGTPVNLLASLDLSGGSKQQVVGLLLRAKAALKKLPLKATDEQARKALAPLVKDLLSLSKCPDFVVNKGHYFGTQFFDEEPEALKPEALKPEDKEALIAFLKTF